MMLVAVAIGTLVVAFGLARWWPNLVRPFDLGGEPPAVTLTATSMVMRVDVPGRVIFSITNHGRTGIGRLSVRGEGPWDAIKVNIVDVDGVFQPDTDSEVGWFLFGQNVRPGESRHPVVVITPRAQGVHRFTFQAFDGRTPLRDASGELATVTLELEVGP